MKTRSFQMFIVYSLLSGLIGTLTGCGGGKSGGGAVVSSGSSRNCIECHASNSKSISPTSGVRITDEWQLSAHNTPHGAGCLDCHSNAHYHDNNVACINCHATAHTDKGTICSDCHGGNSPNLGDCRSCHANVHKDPNSCVRCHGGEIPVDVVMKNPDFAGKCFDCHKNGRNFKRYSVAVRHFNNFTDPGKHPAMYVTINYQKACTACHEPHNPLKGLGRDQRTAWAKSGHGDVNGAAWSEEDFSGNVSCIRCHTTTGFIDYVKSDFTLPRSTWAAAGDKGREVLTCLACHLSSNFKNSVRQVDNFIAPYGVVNFVATAPLTFPDVDESNICIPCHAGRENGTSLKKTVSDFSNASFKNPHYLAAAAVFYGLGGFKFYSSANQTPYAPQAYTSRYGVVVDGTIIRTAAAATYAGGTPAIAVGDVLVGNKAPWSHGKLGMSFVTAAATTGANVGTIKDNAGNILDSGSKGQCVACHLGPKNTHSFGAYSAARATWKAGRTLGGCYGCHVGEDMQEVAELDERPKFDAAMAFFKYELQRAGIFYADAYPYFYSALYNSAYTESGSCTDNLPVKNWQAGGTSTFTWDATKSSCASATGVAGTAGTGPGRMGTAMNFKLLTAEKGAHVHNRTFMKQSIFDSIQYLQTGNVNFSNRYILSGSTADPNGLLNFGNYSTSLIGTGNAGAITATVRGYISRKNTGTGTPAAIGSKATPLYTRP